MTDTTHEAPEQVWCIFDKYGHGSTMIRDLSQINNPLYNGPEPTKYVRADLVQAAVAAALKEASQMLEEVVADIANPAKAKVMYVASQAVLALITPDAQAALDRVVAAERERCAKVAEGYLGCEAIAAAIREGGEG